MSREERREIPYNFTSADDRLIINHLFGRKVWESLEELRSQRITGRSARLVMRFIGDLFILQRNPFLLQELIDSSRRRKHFFRTAATDLGIIEKGIEQADIPMARKTMVSNLLATCRKYLQTTRQEIKATTAKRAKMKKTLGAIVGSNNIVFDPFSLIAHATDAADWRLHLPFAVIYPDSEEQVAPLLKAIKLLGLRVIPRGAGTGLTGGCVPLRKNCVIINTEKLNKIYDIRYLSEENSDLPAAAVIKAEAGVITQDVMRFSREKGFIFATDPTSSWASTVGGNVAENAGGKKAVLWGTAIDNIYSYNIVLPAYGLCKVQRNNHTLRKILPDDTLHFTITNQDNTYNKTLTIPAAAIRKPGLGKDITNKTLCGLPGIQKEGTDGIITSAEFILHTPYEKQVTFCLEFFGNNMDEASRVIVDISQTFKNEGAETLMALEHFDQEYIKAINYKFKATRSESPKAVLLIDMVAHTDRQLEQGKKRFRDLLTSYPDTELFIARDEEEAKRFWQDRKRLGAISARTNAFKLNEDIVLPLNALAKFAGFVDTYNIEEDICNKELFVRQIIEYLKKAEPISDPDWLEAKLPRAHDLCAVTLKKLGKREAAYGTYDREINTLIEDLLELFTGYERISAIIQQLYTDIRKKQIIIATHMHAGDGNIHVNIPVFSNDREMMKRAESTAETVMAKAIELDGVVSGEHGIGITKLKFLEQSRLEELRNYRRTMDPSGLMNPGMLEDPNIINKVFTPSFKLLALEAKILQHGKLEELSSKIGQCIRCGKCKPDCCVFIPSANVFFHPRNKNLAIASLIEAILYDMQRYHFPRYNQLKNLQEIADHCTMCGKCYSPCPVNIDTAEVSVLERQILAEIGYKKQPVATTLSLQYLKSRKKLVNTVFRKTVIDWGSRGQRLGHKLLMATPDSIKKRTTPLFQLLQSPMALPSKKTIRDILPPCNSDEAFVFKPEQKSTHTVFYFPGCGSERLHGQIAMASLYILLKSNYQVVLPPPYLCCGFPARVNAKKKMHTELSLRDTIILSQIRDMLGHVTFDGIVISCGTCKESLSKMGIEDIFGCRIVDVNEYVTSGNKELFKNGIMPCLYHAPCHDSLQGQGTALLRDIGLTPKITENCCSEAGTMVLSRPDISSSMRMQKRDNIQKQMSDIQQEKSILYTNCPSCISGLSRNSDLGVQPKHIAELLAETAGGTTWKDELALFVESAEKVTF